MAGKIIVEFWRMRSFVATPAKISLFVFTFSNYVYWIVFTNIYFIAINALFIFFFMTLTKSFSNIGLYALALIPSVPAGESIVLNVYVVLKSINF